MATLYDEIGETYRSYREPDPRIMAMLERSIGECEKVVNIGAGTGSYEPLSRDVVAVEPSLTMISQRTDEAAPIVQARAEALPFKTGAFDLAMALLTIHHWSDQERGLREALRVANGKLVILTWVGFPTRYWLVDYFPEIEEIDLENFPSIKQLQRALGSIRVETVLIPEDCLDGFLCAYWRRPAAYLDSGVRKSISTFSKIRNVNEGLSALARDLETGEWERMYGASLSEDAQDFGYRIVVCGEKAV